MTAKRWKGKWIQDPRFDGLAPINIDCRWTEEKEARELAEQLLVQMGLKDRLQHKPGELSGGESQRVALARGLINKPGLLLADEPTGNLDNKASDSLIELIQSLNSELGQTVVVVTHSQRIASKMDRVMELSGGLINPVEKSLII